MKNYDVLPSFNSKLQIFTLVLNKILSYIQSSNLNLALLLTKPCKLKLLSANSTSKALW